MVELLEIRESIDGWLDQGSVYIMGVPRVRHDECVRSKYSNRNICCAAPFSKTAGQAFGPEFEKRHGTADEALTAVVI